MPIGIGSQQGASLMAVRRPTSTSNLSTHCRVQVRRNSLSPSRTGCATPKDCVVEVSGPSQTKSPVSSEEMYATCIKMTENAGASAVVPDSCDVFERFFARGVERCLKYLLLVPWPSALLLRQYLHSQPQVQALPLRQKHRSSCKTRRRLWQARLAALSEPIAAR